MTKLITITVSGNFLDSDTVHIPGIEIHRSKGENIPDGPMAGKKSTYSLVSLGCDTMDELTDAMKKFDDIIELVDSFHVGISVEAARSRVEHSSVDILSSGAIEILAVMTREYGLIPNIELI